MRRYRRSNKGYTAKFMTWFDTSSSVSYNTVFRFTVGGREVKARLGSMFGAFKYYKILGHRITCIPAATLPGDPAQLSYTAGEYGIDFRDQLNVGLVRFTNGEPFPNMDALKSADADTAEKAYYALMMDPRWSKFGLQKGFKRFCKPMLYDDGLNVKYPIPDQISESYWDSSNPVVDVGQKTIDGSKVPAVLDIPGSDMSKFFGVNAFHRFQSGRKQLLGWLPTDDMLLTGPIGWQAGSAIIPDCQTLTVVLPKAFKTKFAFRFVITTYVKFAGLKYENVGESSGSSGLIPDVGVYAPLDDEPSNSLPPLYLGDGSN